MGHESIYNEIENLELPIEGDELDVLLKNRILFHGSYNSDTSEFVTSEEADDKEITDGTTVGKGLYLTSSERSASGYARRRAKHTMVEGLSPTLYEVKVDNMKLLDLRTTEHIVVFSEKYRTYLLDELKDADSKYNGFIRIAIKKSIADALEEIFKGVSLKSMHILAGYAMADIFTDFVKKEGYEGIITIEGGEGMEDEGQTFTDQHDTYVVFDPTKVSIRNKSVLS
jgi:hypothetical protein